MLQRVDGGSVEEEKDISMRSETSHFVSAVLARRINKDQDTLLVVHLITDCRSIYIIFRDNEPKPSQPASLTLA
jgi:hypothetical protein